MPRIVRLTATPSPVVPKPVRAVAEPAACRFCAAPAIPTRATCQLHVGLGFGPWMPCGACRTPIDRILGPLATPDDLLCLACAFRRRSRETLRRAAC